jgi:hypothetical protein
MEQTDRVTLNLYAADPTRLVEEPSLVSVRFVGVGGHAAEVQLEGPRGHVWEFIARHWGIDELRNIGAIHPEELRLVMNADRAHAVANLAETLQIALRTRGYSAGGIEDEELPTPGGTTEFAGRVQAFSVRRHEGRDYRVLVEDVTADEDAMPE